MRALCLLLLVAACAPAVAQQPPDRDIFFGAGSCAAQACHGGGSADRQEYKIWSAGGKHSSAFRSLSGDLGRRIGERLGIDPSTAPECLSCHGVVGARTAATFALDDGVSCELCHGASGRWLGAHAAPGFKARLAADKEALGLVDLTTPASRAARCVACHVGSEGRDVTHAMMAAGHPPLFFSLPESLDAMPPHWKKKDAPGDFAAWEAGAKAVAVARLRQIARMAGGAKEWPEFAAFDCYGCHREIRGRGGAGAKGRPGDLRLDLAALEVLAAGDPSLAGRLEKILGTAYRPGGPRRPLAESATDMANDVERLPLAVASAEEFIASLDGALALVEAGGSRMGYATMKQVELLAFALATNRESPAFAEAYRALGDALAGPYDEAACAALARRALAALR